MLPAVRVRAQRIDIETAEHVVGGLLGRADDPVALLHPGPVAGSECIAAAFRQRLDLARILLEWRGYPLADQPHQAGQHDAGQRRGPRNTPDRHACRPDHDQLTATRELTQTQQSAQQGGNGQHLEGLRRQQEHRDQQRIDQVVAAGTDVLLLADEHEQRR